MAKVNAPNQSVDGLEKPLPGNFFDEKINKVLYFQLSNFLLQYKYYWCPFFEIIQICDKLSLPQQIKYFAKKVFTLYLGTKEECIGENYDILIVASLTFILKSYSHFNQITEIIWQGLKEKEEWSHISQSDVQSLENQLKNFISLNHLSSPYDPVSGLIQYFNQLVNHEALLVSCIDLAITLPESVFYPPSTICFGSLNLVFDLLGLNMEEKQNQIKEWNEYKVEDVRAFFLVLKERYLVLVEGSGDEETD